MKEGKTWREQQVETMDCASFTLVTLLCGLEDHTIRALEQAKQTGAWIPAILRTWDDTVLSEGGFRDGLAMRYHHHPVNLPPIVIGVEPGLPWIMH